MIIYIPARSGSKRIKDKNIYKIGKFSLLELAVIRSLETSIGTIIISSDSEKYLSIIKDNKRIIKYKRPINFAKDDTTICESIINDISSIYKNNYQGNICVIQPTNPFTKIEDLNNACKLYQESPKGTIVSVTKLPYKKDELFYKDINSKKVIPIDNEKPNQDLMYVDGNFAITNMNLILENKSFWSFTNDLKPFYQNVDYTIDIDYPWMIEQAKILWESWVRNNDQKKYYKKYINLFNK